jgi:predicted ATPase
VSGVPDPGHGTRRGNLLVGRATERATVGALLGDAERGVAGSLLITGPAGIGKSALVHYVIDGGSGFRVVRIVGVESEMVFGYAAVHQPVPLLPFECGSLRFGQSSTQSRWAAGSPGAPSGTLDAGSGPGRGATVTHQRASEATSDARGRGVGYHQRVNEIFAAFSLREAGKQSERAID